MAKFFGTEEGFNKAVKKLIVVRQDNNLTENTRSQIIGGSRMTLLHIVGTSIGQYTVRTGGRSADM